MTKKIICFLTVNPSVLFVDFCKKLVNDRYDVYICIDDNNVMIHDHDDRVKIIKMDNKICEDDGFKSTVLWLDNRACSRDKALYYFCKNDIEYEYIWFLEEDVFIPSIDTIENIDNLYEDGDLLVANHLITLKKKLDSNWRHVNKQIKIPPPYACSMICAIRCSKKLLTCINDYAMKYNNLFLDEMLFNTISLQNNLNVRKIRELSKIVYRREWRKNQINKNYLYHPIKSIATQYDYRIE